MTDVRTRPAYLLHAVVAHLDAVAEVLVQESHGISYSRFLVLLAVERGEPTTQRDLAASLGISEPAASKAVAGLVAADLVVVEQVPGRGNRRQVGLSRRGRRAVEEGSDVLEGAFATLMAAADVQAGDVVDLSTRLLALLAPAPVEDVA